MSKNMYHGTENKYYNRPLCKPHEEWVTLGNPGNTVEVFLRSSGGIISNDVEVFLDLADIILKPPTVPKKYQKYLSKENGKNKIEIITWKIIDGRIDNEIVNFVYNMLMDGISVGWGCVRGHGRTGWLAAKIHQLITGCTGDEAVEYIWKVYCKEAIESTEQFKDLGCKKHIPAPVVYDQDYWKKKYFIDLPDY